MSKARHFLITGSLAAICATSLAGCGSSSSTGSSGSSTSGGTASSSASSASSNSASQAVVSGSAGSTVNSVQGATGSVTGQLVRAQRFVRGLAAGGNQNVTATYEFETETVDCEEDGTMTFSGTESYTLADDYSSFSAEGSLTSEFDDCTEDVIVEASDGTCLITGSMTGSFDTDFTFDMPDLTAETFTMSIDMVTGDGGLDMTVEALTGDGTSFNVEFDLHADGDQTGVGEITGTITIDGEEFDINEDIDTSSFTMEEMGCVEVEDTDNDGEEDAEPGEDGYDIDDDGDDAATGGDLSAENFAGIWVHDGDDTTGDPSLETLDQVYFFCDGTGELSFNTESLDADFDDTMDFTLDGDDLTIANSGIDNFTLEDVVFEGEVGVEGEYTFTGTLDGMEHSFTLTDLGTDQIGDCELTAAP